MRFVDTSFWIALRFSRDDHHEVARGLWSTGEGGVLLTTNHVAGETWTFLRRRIGHAEARGFIDNLERTDRVSVVHVDDPTEADAWAWLRRHDERPYSFVDATSFAIMRRQRIREAFAFDGDFSAAGFVEVRP
ncbi:MAG: PIN domain-containing protein [Chloroflexi bacterium]|nr:PIN domain-containing protein [Chloroflexota bacterium]